MKTEEFLIYVAPQRKTLRRYIRRKPVEGQVDSITSLLLVILIGSGTRIVWLQRFIYLALGLSAG